MALYGSNADNLVNDNSANVVRTNFVFCGAKLGEPWFLKRNYAEEFEGVLEGYDGKFTISLTHIFP